LTNNNPLLKGTKIFDQVQVREENYSSFASIALVLACVTCKCAVMCVRCLLVAMHCTQRSKVSNVPEIDACHFQIFEDDRDETKTPKTNYAGIFDDLVLAPVIFYLLLYLN
jgi:hypothetical protein